MAAEKMHADEVDIDVTLVGWLIADQFPQWTHLSVRPVPSAGTDNAIFRLGADMAVRLPRVSSAATRVSKEREWLPRLAPFLPLDVPVPLATGNPSGEFPWNWSICRWLLGQDASINRLADPGQAAVDLAQFIRALQEIDPTGGPGPGEHNAFRGEPLARRDTDTRAGISSLEGVIDVAAATAVWGEALGAPAWHRPAVWIHGDLQSGNLLARRGRLSGVIDFGCLGVGDPACDLMVAWNLFDGPTRERFRATLQIDEATWRRGRGWALSFAVIALPYYCNSNPVLAEIARYTTDQTLADHR